MALMHVNMTDTGKLSGLLPLFLGMDIKVTHKVAPPHIVQEATGEVLAIGFHERESFGLPEQFQRAGGLPHAEHPCWKKGWVKLDFVPRWIEIRFHGSSVDYTGTQRPGVYVMEPVNADWELRYQSSKVINHPNERPVRRRGPRINVGMRSTQLPVAPAGVGTYNNMQGKTAKDELSVPMGHTVDLKLLDGNDDKWLHYYMILGRATSLATTLLLNFPEISDEEPDWSIFESGPPEYLTHVFQELQKRHMSTSKTLANKLAVLRIFPPFSCLPPKRFNASTRSYLYDPAEWNAALNRPKKRKEGLGATSLIDRLERRAEEPPRRKQRV